MKTKLFTSMVEYENWTELFENCSDYEEIPSAIDDGFKIMMDMFTECKSWKVALRRFGKQFADVDASAGIKDWVEGMRESCENGYFKDTDGWKPGWNCTPEEYNEYVKGGTYSWAVEEIDEGRWYIFLNISGVYAGREARA